MRRKDILLVATIALSVCVNVLTSAKHDASAPRTLRDEEERQSAIVSFLSTTAEKMQFWRPQLAGKSLDEAFTSLKIAEVGNKLLDTQRFNRWAGHAITTLKDDAYTAMLERLATHFGHGYLAVILKAGAKTPHANAIATKLQDAQIDTLVKSEKSIDDVFETLKLHEKSDKLLLDPRLNVRLNVWLTVAAKKHPEENLSQLLMKTLVNHFKDEELLLAAEKIDDKDNVATSLRDMIKAWTSREMDAHKAFLLLQLDKAGGRITSPNFKLWLRYINNAHKDDSTEIITALLKYFKDEKDLVRKLELAKRKPNISEFAADLQRAFMRTLNEAHTADSLFAELGLNIGIDQLYKNPDIDIFVTFMAVKPKPETAINTFLKRYSTDELTKWLEEVQTTTPTAEAAINTLRMQLDNYTKSPKVSSI